MSLSPRGCKAKGKKLQNDVKRLLVSAFPEYEKDLKSTVMGESGEDIQISPAARKAIPYQFECKSRASMAVFRDFDQAKRHGEYEAVLVIKENGSKPLAVIDLEKFIELIWYRHNYREAK